MGLPLDSGSSLGAGVVGDRYRPTALWFWEEWAQEIWFKLAQ